MNTLCALIKQNTLKKVKLLCHSFKVYFETWCFQFASKQMSLPVDKIKRNTSTQMLFSLKTKRFPVTWPCDVTSNRSFRRWSPPLLFPCIKCGQQEWQGSPQTVGQRRYTASSGPLYSFSMLAALEQVFVGCCCLLIVSNKCPMRSDATKPSY